MSREIRKPLRKSGKNCIVKHGKLEIKWCELCGEYNISHVPKNFIMYI